MIRSALYSLLVIAALTSYLDQPVSASPVSIVEITVSPYSRYELFHLDDRGCPPHWPRLELYDTELEAFVDWGGADGTAGVESACMAAVPSTVLGAYLGKQVHHWSGRVALFVDVPELLFAAMPKHIQDARHAKWSDFLELEADIHVRVLLDAATAQSQH